MKVYMDLNAWNRVCLRGLPIDTGHHTFGSLMVPSSLHLTSLNLLCVHTANKDRQTTQTTPLLDPPLYPSPLLASSSPLSPPCSSSCVYYMNPALEFTKTSHTRQTIPLLLSRFPIETVRSYSP